MADHQPDPIGAAQDSASPYAAHVARLVAAAPPLTPGRLAELSLIMAPALAALAAERAEAAVPSVQPAVAA